MADPANPFFARSLVNRYWKHFFGRGVVEPEDDMRVTNPASNPELLDGAGRPLRRQRLRPEGFGAFRSATRTCISSRPSRITTIATTSRTSRAIIRKRLNAEVLLDALDVVTASPTSFAGLPAGTRAVQLPDTSVEFVLPDGLRPARIVERLRMRAVAGRQSGAESAPAQLGRSARQAFESGRAARPSSAATSPFAGR